MQEPPRQNLYSVLLKNMKAAQKKIYLHRVIYIASYDSNPDMKVQELRSFIILTESNIKLINEDYNEDILTGFGLFYPGYIINVVEGPESTFLKHLRSFMETLNKNLSQTPKINKMKALLVNYHINKRYFSTWYGRQATPPVLLDKIEPSTSPEINTRYAHQCAIKLFKLYDYLEEQPPNLLKATLDNISELCQLHLPEVLLLEFLLDSPLLLDLKNFVDSCKQVPPFPCYNEMIWPLPSEFVPYNILDATKKKELLIMEDTVEEGAKMEEVEGEELEGEKEEDNDEEKPEAK